jgi:predicted Zn-dependent protease
MKSMNSDLTQAIATLDLPVDWIGLRAVKETIAHRSVRDQVPQANGKSLSQGVMVEVLVNDQIGYAATNSLQRDSIHAAAKAAYQQAIAASRWGIYPMTTALRPPVVGRYSSPVIKPLDALTPGEINDLLMRLCQTLKLSDRVVQTNAMAITNNTESWFVSSSGSDVYQQFVMLETHYGVTAQEGAIVQQRSNNGHLAHCYQGGWELFLDDELWEQARQTGEQAVELLSAAECPTMTSTLVLAPDQMMLQIHESVGHPLELDRILGDERNYAGGSFVKPSDFGQLAYGSPLMNIL